MRKSRVLITIGLALFFICIGLWSIYLVPRVIAPLFSEELCRVNEEYNTIISDAYASGNTSLLPSVLTPERATSTARIVTNLHESMQAEVREFKTLECESIYFALNRAQIRVVEQEKSRIISKVTGEIITPDKRYPDLLEVARESTVVVEMVKDGNAWKVAGGHELDWHNVTVK